MSVRGRASIGQCFSVHLGVRSASQHPSLGVMQHAFCLGRPSPCKAVGSTERARRKMDPFRTRRPETRTCALLPAVTAATNLLFSPAERLGRSALQPGPVVPRVPACRSLKKASSDSASTSKAEQTGVPWSSIFLWACSIFYWYLFFGSTILPGYPSWIPQPEGVSEILNESINFWYANILFETAGWPHIPNEAVHPCSTDACHPQQWFHTGLNWPGKQHPVSEAIFNFGGAFSFLMLPLFIYDDKGKRKVGMWTAILFLTNFLMWPYMAIRADFTHKHDKDLEPTPAKVPLPGMRWIPWAPAVAGTSVAVALFSVWWGLFGRPEFGDLAQRWEYLKYAVTHDRAFDVSVSDTICYSFWQFVLMQGAPVKYRVVPFAGLAAWLLDLPEQRRVLETAQQKQNEVQ